MQAKRGTYKGGAIGRWGYDGIIYDRKRGKLILENPWRMEKTDNTVEPEFAKFDKRIPGNNNRPDIEIDVTPATLEDGVDFAGNDVKIVFLEDNGENENCAGFWRLGGIGDFRVPGVIFIRRSLWKKADIDQKQELYGHEYLHYNGFSHKEAVSKQHKGGLTPLIKDQFQQDKKTYGGINVTQGTINLQTSGSGNDFKINNQTDLNYTGLKPKVVALVNLTQADFSALLSR